MVSVILIGISLSMDAFAVSVSAGISIRERKLFHALRSSFFFGFFQFIMPVTGWYLGKTLAVYISAWDHWIAFGLLAFIGGKMIWETLRARKKTSEDKNGTAPWNGKSPSDLRSLPFLLTLSFATSIDALAVGLSFSILNRGIWSAALAIGGITFAICITGFEFGRRIGALLEKWAEIAGGLILIGIGAKILAEHLLG
ncbi:MAG: manganese efflux pump MntP family protein [Treponema sp.]|jgi:putative Mn2+ efflux pump MntP|nr:manganese efflux pump MntP family protein [Treponema sp.]